MADKTFGHRAVLQTEALQALNIRQDGIYIDATFGRGGHSQCILDGLGDEGMLYAMDRDPEAAKVADENFKNEKRFVFEQMNFSALKELADKHGIAGKVDGILLDIGVSSPQLDDARRGFSFMQDGPLDMRMDTTQGETAAQWLMHAEEVEIADVLWRYGEERQSRRIARKIVQAREQEALSSTTQLAELIRECVPQKKTEKKHPATRSFQAIRIFINKELDELMAALEQIPDVLRQTGRLVVISFHSLEDRVVKRFMRELSMPKKLPRHVPVKTDDESGVRFRHIGKAIKASEHELQENIRARSAVMRVCELLR